MSRIEKANQLLRETEERLGELVGEAVSAGEYDEAVKLTVQAKAVAELIAVPSIDGAKNRGKEVSAPGASNSATKRRRGKKRKSHTRKSRYPRFVTQGENLIKIGWSKKSKGEYKHKAPWQIVSLVARSVAQANPNGSLVTFEDFMPLVDGDGNEVPTYQAYLTLAWFRHAGLIDQEGRKGYKVDSSRLTEAMVQEKWKLLPEV